MATTYYDYHAVMDRVFQAGGKVSIARLAKDHGWGRERFAAAVDELIDAGMAEMNYIGKGAVVAHMPYLTRQGIVSLASFNGEGSQAIVDYLVKDKPLYGIDAPYHDYSGWVKRNEKAREYPRQTNLIANASLSDEIPF